MAYLVVACIFAGVGIALWWGLGKVIAVEPPPVTIAPAKVLFGSTPANAPNALSSMYSFRLSNTLEQDVYSITFKLRVESSKYETKDFQFDVPKSSQKPMDANDPNSAKLGDIIGMDCVDAQKRPVFLRFIHHLEAKESREVTLMRVNNSVVPLKNGTGLPQQITTPQAEDKEAVTVTALVSHFATEQEPQLKGANLSAIPVYLDEPLTCGAISFVPLK